MTVIVGALGRAPQDLKLGTQGEVLPFGLGSGLKKLGWASAGGGFALRVRVPSWFRPSVRQFARLFDCNFDVFPRTTKL